MTLVRPAVIGVLIAAGLVHLVLTPEHFHEGFTQGTAFAIDGVALVVAGGWLARSRSAAARLGAVGIAVATAAAYLASRTVGLPVFGREGWDLVGSFTSAAELASAALIAVISNEAAGGSTPVHASTVLPAQRNQTR